MGKKSKLKTSTGNQQQAVILEPSIETLIPLLTQEKANEMARILLSPTRMHGVSSHLRDESDLSSYLRDVFTVTDFAASYFADDLIKALVDEKSDHINKQIPINNVGRDKHSLLAICCQWKQMQKVVGWKGKSEMVKIILAHPKIRVNDVMPNGCNAAFMCVKYANIDTLNSIIDAGCDLSQKDEFGQTLLSNTVEYPNPDILRTVLNHVSPHEVFKKTIKPNDVERIPFSAADLIVTHYAFPPVSWQIMGHPPPIEDAAECLVILRQLGVKLTYHPKMVQWHALAACFDSIERYKSFGMVNAEDFKKLGECILGLWFPPVIQNTIESSEDCEDSCNLDDDVSCAVCLRKLMEQPVKLYCGHSFCLDCIVEAGKHHTKCPLCRRKLCLDAAPDRDVRLVSEIDERDIRRFLGGALDEDGFFVKNTVTLEGVSNLSDAQVLEEAGELGIRLTSSSSVQIRDKLKSEILKGHGNFLNMVQEKNSMEITESYDSAGRIGKMMEIGGMVLETSATHSVATPQQTVVSPHHGPVCVEITVKGIPVLASISNNSKYTMVSPKFRETFRLKQIPNLTTTKMRFGYGDIKVGRSICLEEFSLTIGDAVVKLRNVIECKTSLVQGIQLGRDFFESARYCSMSIKMSDQKSPFWVTNGTASWTVSNRQLESESLRYYSHDNKIVKVPIIHFVPTQKHQVSAIRVKEGSILKECSYCCRTFPTWAYSVCWCCKEEEQEEKIIRYCDERCQKASRKLHKIRKPDCRKMS